MAEDLRQMVEKNLLPAVREYGLAIVDSERAESFDNASVTLSGPVLRLRIVRERSQIFADFGPPSDPQTWYDSAVIMDFLGLSDNAGFHDRDSGAVLGGVGAFIGSFHGELAEAFDERRLPITKHRLEALKEARATRMFGG